MSPKLSLAYLGSGDNGPLGYNWALQGVSSITRCPATVATDGVRSGVNLVPDDKLCLDGQRLVQTAANGTPAAFPQTGDSSGQASGSYLEFRTESDTFVRVRAYGIAVGTDATTGPAWFRVWTKAGQVLDFGAAPSADSNTQALVLALTSPIAYSKQVGMVWALARASDQFGNVVDYKYAQRMVAWGTYYEGIGTKMGQLGSEWNIAEIQYSGAKVVFNYLADDSRPDKQEAIHKGNKTVSVRRLSSITTYVNSPNTSTLGPASSAVAVKTYKLGYDIGPITNRSRLHTVAECAGTPGSTRCLPPTTMTYSAGGDDRYSAAGTFNLQTLVMQSTTGTSGVLVADFDGDGKSDILRWSDTPASNALYLSNGDGSFRPANFNLTTQNLFKSDGCYLSMVGDFNGDGLPDILRYSASADINGKTCASPAGTQLFLNNGDGTFSAPIAVTVPLARIMSTSTTPGAAFHAMDVNGDGILDLVTTRSVGNTPCSTTAPCTRVFLGSRSGTFQELTTTNMWAYSTYAPPGFGYQIDSPELENVADLNEDGLADLFAASTLFFSQGNGNFTQVISNASCSVFQANAGLLIDYSGGGKLACLSRATSAPSNYLEYSYGDSGENYAFNAAFNLNVAGDELAGTNIGALIADVNGDGKQDILRWETDATKNVLFLSNGDGTFTPSSTFNLTTPDAILFKSDNSYASIVGDFTGHGNVEILRLAASPSAGAASSNQLYVKMDQSPPDQLQTVTNINGFKTAYQYVPIANAPSVYVPDRGTANAANGTSGSVVDALVPMYLVSGVTSDTGIGTNTTTTDYTYVGQKVDLTGRGAIGFRAVSVTSPAPDQTVLTQFDQFMLAYPYYGQLASRTISHTATPISTETYVYCDAADPAASPAGAISAGKSCAPGANKVHQPYLLYSTSTGTDLDGTPTASVVSQFSMNNSGLTTQAVQTTTGNVGGSMQQIVSTTTNTPQPDDISCSAIDTCHWILARVTASTVTRTVPNTILPTSAGTSPTATQTSGTQKVAPPVSAWLPAILELLLAD